MITEQDYKPYFYKLNIDKKRFSRLEEFGK